MRLSTIFILLVTAFGGRCHCQGARRCEHARHGQVGDKRLDAQRARAARGDVFSRSTSTAPVSISSTRRQIGHDHLVGSDKRMVLRFVRDVDRGDIREGWKEGLAHNATVKLATIQPMIDQSTRGW